MNGRVARLLASGSIYCGVAFAAPVQHTCEFRHPRMGQMPEDYKYALDLETKRCTGEPCRITDDELSWSTQGGRYTITINRLTRAGQIVREGELLTILKNCRPADAKP